MKLCKCRSGSQAFADHPDQMPGGRRSQLDDGCGSRIELWGVPCVSGTISDLPQLFMPVCLPHCCYWGTHRLLLSRRCQPMAGGQSGSRRPLVTRLKLRWLPFPSLSSLPSRISRPPQKSNRMSHSTGGMISMGRRLSPLMQSLRRPLPLKRKCQVVGAVASHQQSAATAGCGVRFWPITTTRRSQRRSRGRCLSKMSSNFRLPTACGWH